MRKIASSKVMKKYVINLPKAVREALMIETGDYVDWFIDRDRIFIEKRKEEKEQ
ncbi:MAG: AbrB/MazE/SpoVT family DNA-binding domain-containing protein [Thermoprotei archaeon]